MNPLLPYLFYLFQVPAFAVPQSEGTLFHYGVRAWPGVTEHQLHWATPRWGLGLESLQLAPFERRSFRARTSLPLLEHVHIQLALGVSQERLTFTPSLSHWNLESTGSIWFQPNKQWATFALAHSASFAVPHLDWELRQLYFIDSHWILTAGWRPSIGSAAPLLVGLHYHHEIVDAYLLNQGNSWSLGWAVHRGELTLLLSLTARPLMPTQNALVWRPRGY